MSIEDSDPNFEQAFLDLKRLAKRADVRDESLSESIRLLREMIQPYDTRFGNTVPKQSNAHTCLSALAAARNKTEEAIAKLKEQLNRLAATIERHVKEGH